MKEPKSLKGIYPALLTPFDGKGRINEGGLSALVSSLIGRGVDGFYVGGSTAETFLLTLEERKRILEIVVKESADKESGGKVRVIAHIGAIGTDFSIELGAHAAKTGADAISSVPPFYYKFSADEIVAYYTDIADAVDLPLIPYNIPSLSGVTLSGPLMKRLRSHKRIVGIKFTSNDLFQLERMKKEDPELIVYNGFDEIFLAGLSMGADGAIGSTFNCMPEKFLGIRGRFLSGDLAGARVLQEEANAVIQVLIDTGKILNAEKYLVELQGIPFGECRRPFAPLTTEDRKNLDRVFAAHLS